MSSELRAAAGRALADVPINVGFARAVVDGVSAGELWSDRPTEPRAFHAVHSYGMSLVWGPDVAGAAADVAARIRGRAAGGAHEWLQVEPRWAGLDWDGMLGAVPLAAYVPAAPDAPDAPAPGAVRRVRVNFAFAPEDFARRWSARVVPAGCTVRRATEADFAWQGGVVPAGFWPDAATFLAHGGGRVAELDGEPAAIAFASFHTGDDVELGIETAPAFRRRGLARLACAALIEDVVASGRTPVWACREDNVASARLAESLGFAVARRLPYYQVLARR